MAAFTPHFPYSRASFRGNLKVQNTLSVQQGLQHSKTGQPVGDTPYGGLKAPPFGGSLWRQLQHREEVSGRHISVLKPEIRAEMSAYLSSAVARMKGVHCEHLLLLLPLGLGSPPSPVCSKFFICHLISFFFSCLQTVGFTKLLRELFYWKEMLKASLTTRWALLKA